MKSKILLSMVLFCLPAILMAQHTIHVPGDQPTIQAGINVAVDDDIVLVDQGTYYENINFKGKAIIVKSHYDPVNPDSSYIMNTVIDGSQPFHADSGSVVFFVSGETTNSILQGFTIQNGTGTFPDLWGSHSGGGVICLNSSATLQHNRIINNVVHENSYGVMGGGGVCAEGDSEDTLIMRFNIIELNEVVTKNQMPVVGGGIFINLYSILENNIIKNNYMEGFAHGGGIGIFPGKGIVSNNLVANNTINTIYSGSWGGGIYLEAPEEVTWITSNKVINNTSFEGGGIAVWIGGMAQADYYLDKNEVVGNSAVLGAGISINSTGGASITNNIIQNNEADINGGGIHLYSSGKSHSGKHLNIENLLNRQTKALNKTFTLNQIANNTITQNNAIAHGGAINIELSTNEFLCFNNIFYNNTAILGEEINIDQSTLYLFYNNIDTSKIEGPGNYIGDYNINEDPLFEPDGYHLTAESPCIEAGVSYLEILGEIYNCPGQDIDGESRPLNDSTDIGVDERLIFIPGIVDQDLLNGNSISVMPNPFTTSTTIEYTLDRPSAVTISIFNPQGQLIERIEQEQPQGEQKVQWNAEGLPAGMYYFRIQAGDEVGSGKMVKKD